MSGKKSNNIFLIGPMGAGKTSIAKQLAKLTGKIRYDSDQEIERQTGVDLPWLFEIEGEAGFRKREKKVIQTLTQLNHIILSTGGGSVIDDDNRKHLAENGIVIYLHISLEEQLKRISSRNNQRPLLASNTPQETLRELNNRRTPLYKEIADLCFTTDNFSPLTLAKNIVSAIEDNA